MAISKQWLHEAKLLCDEPGPEDGVDPRELARFRLTRKTKQNRPLEKVAQRTISLWIMAELADDVFRDIDVAAVQLTEDGQFLWVLIHHYSSAQAQTEVALQKLNALQGYLRAQVARAVNRKRVPVLKFEVLQMDR
ncbi:ribosome-binding factor A [Gynuella sunshinyii]|uniref:Ribosome-binding factor A n=1 Tax=Gynuella sunshinyii YC6258 TaxID=1445510 RepID=A0A0C5VL53_9GAMM|nr:ribosome-binding factor A [Gynuella sunshinyii]AJQ94098.1 ribosome-binding factor A [Gynuella sunshinyii YC6258]